MPNRFYIEFKTWAEGSVDIPWPFANYGEVDDYRSKTDTNIKVHPERVKSTFMSMDEAVCTKFLLDHVAALLCGVIIETNDPDTAVIQITKTFGSCEVSRIILIDRSNEAAIIEAFGGAVNTPKLG